MGVSLGVLSIDFYKNEFKIIWLMFVYGSCYRTSHFNKLRLISTFLIFAIGQICDTIAKGLSRFVSHAQSVN